MKVTIKDISYLSIIIGILLLCIHSCWKSGNSNDAFLSVSDTLQKTRNELGQEKSTIAALMGSIDDLQNINASKDSTIAKLKKLVNKNTISATVLSNVTTGSIKTETVFVHYTDTVVKDSLVYVFPVYKTAYENRWENFNATARRDSFEIHYKVFNEFEIKHEWKRKNIFSKKYAEISVLNLNPNTETKELKTFIVRQPRQNKFIVFLGGFAAGFLLFTVTQK